MFIFWRSMIVMLDHGCQPGRSDNKNLARKGELTFNCVYGPNIGRRIVWNNIFWISGIPDLATITKNESKNPSLIAHLILVSTNKDIQNLPQFSIEWMCAKFLNCTNVSEPRNVTLYITMALSAKNKGFKLSTIKQFYFWVRNGKYWTILLAWSIIFTFPKFNGFFNLFLKITPIPIGGKYLFPGCTQLLHPLPGSMWLYHCCSS